MSWTNDPVADFLRKDAAQAKWEAGLPVCDCCGEPIMDEYFFTIDGDNYCEECLNKNFRHENEV